MAAPITVYEVGPRDGLQNEARQVPTSGKLELLGALADPAACAAAVGAEAHPPATPAQKLP